MLVTMTYQNACFISYKRPPQRSHRHLSLGKPTPKHLWVEFAEVFQEKLDKYLTTNFPSFRDEHLQPGADYPRELAVNLCKSVCMVALVVPEYFESSWCKAEWMAMASWEEKRVGKGRAQLIFPVICTGEADMLRERFGPRLDVDLRHIVSPVKQMNSINTLRKIRGIAERINSLAKTVPPPDIDCDTYSLGIVGPDVNTPEVSEPSPFRR
jgi:TIR domain